MEGPEPLDPSEAEDMFEDEGQTESEDVFSLHYYHVNHEEDSSLKVESINSLHSQIINWYDAQSGQVKRIVVHHKLENMTHSFNANLSDGSFPVESCPCYMSSEDAGIWIYNGQGLDKVPWGAIDVEPVTDEREKISHLLV